MNDTKLSCVSDYHAFFAGMIAGWSGVLTGQPFDLVKVRLQSSSQNLKIVEVVRSIFVYEGFRAYWKGSLSPLIGSGIGNSINLGTLEYAKRKIKDYNQGQSLSLKQHALAGACSGMVSSLVSCPSELFRIKIQLQGAVKCPGEPHYRSTFDAIFKITKCYGIKGICRAYPITLLRDSLGNSVFYFVYQLSLLKLAGNQERKNWKILISGGLSGLIYWLSIYPIDLIKSRIQADSLSFPIYRSPIHCLKQTLQKEGGKFIFKGMLPCMLRSFPVSAIYIFTFENTMLILSNI